MEDEVRRRWWRVLEALRRRSPSSEIVLRRARVEGVVGDAIVVSWAYRIHREIMIQTERRALVEALIAEVMERPYRLRCELRRR